MDMEKVFKTLQTTVNNIINDYCSTISNKKLANIVTYSFNGGKRLRPLIILSISQHLDIQDENSKLCILIVELLHSASLILDDLPCMDNDILRRGNETVHYKYGIKPAYVTANFMIGAAINRLFEIVDNLQKETMVANNPQNMTYKAIIHKIVDIVFTQNNYTSIGQLVDLSNPDSNNPDSTCNTNMLYNSVIINIKKNTFITDFLHTATKTTNKTTTKTTAKDTTDKILSLSLKTYPLFYLSFQLPLLVSNTQYDIDLKKIEYIAFTFSLLFQIADDFEDYEKDLKTAKNNSFIKILDKELAYDLYTRSVHEFTVLLKALPKLDLDIFKYIVQMLDKKINSYHNHGQN